jgi:hypothetical protein
MPKLEPIERFRISIETDVSNLGPIMAQLAKMDGHTITGNELITDVRRLAHNNNTGNTS